MLRALIEKIKFLLALFLSREITQAEREKIERQLAQATARYFAAKAALEPSLLEQQPASSKDPTSWEERDGEMIYDPQGRAAYYVDDRMVYGLDGLPVFFTVATDEELIADEISDLLFLDANEGEVLTDTPKERPAAVRACTLHQCDNARPVLYWCGEQWFFQFGTGKPMFYFG